MISKFYLGQKNMNLTTYNPNQFCFSTKRSTTKTIVRITHPENDNNWNSEISSKFIESIIIRVPMNKVWFDGIGDDRDTSGQKLYRIIDGHKRISALRNFFDDKLTLSNLDFIVSLNGLKFSEIERRYQRRIEETEIDVAIIDVGTPWFIRDNIIKRIKS